MQTKQKPDDNQNFTISGEQHVGKDQGPSVAQRGGFLSFNKWATGSNPIRVAPPTYSQKWKSEFKDC